MADTQQNILINIDLETGQVNSELEKIDSKIKNLGDGAKIETFKSVRNQIREAREEAVRLAIAIEQAEAAGENVDNLTKRYGEVTQKAASLNDAVDKTNKSISNANPDNRLQGLISIAQGAVVAVQGLAGAFTVLGVDSETANESIARLQGLIALTGAISSIDDIIDGYKDLKNNINLAGIATKVMNAGTIAATVIQRAFTGSVIATGFAFKALRAALISTGIGALVVILGLLIEKIIDLVSATDDATAAQDRLNKKQKEASEVSLKNIDRATQIRIAKLKLAGASELEIEQAKLDALRAKSNQYYTDIARARDNYNKETDVERKNAAAQELNDLKAANDDLLQEIALQKINIQQVNKDAAEKNNKEQQDLLDKDLDTTQKKVEENAKEINDFLKQKRKEEENSRKAAIEVEIRDIEEKYKEIIDKTKQNSKERIELEKLRDAEIARARAENAAKTIRETNQLEVDVVERRLKFFQDKLKEQSKNLRSDVSSNVLSSIIEDIKSIYEISKEVRIKQIQLERDANIAALKDVDEATRQTRTKLYKDDADSRIAALKASIDEERETLVLNLDLFRVAEIDEKRIADATTRVNRLIERNLLRLNPFQELVSTELISGINKIADLDRNLAVINRDERLKSLQDYYREQNRLQAESIVDQNEREVTQRFLAETYNEEKLEIYREYNDEITRIEEKSLKDQAEARKKILQASARDNSFGGFFNKKIFDQNLKELNAFYDAQVDEENARFIAERNKRIANNEEIESLERDHKQRLLDIGINYKNGIVNLNDATLGLELDLYNEIGNALGSLSALIGQNTREGKIAAAAEIAIQTATGYISGLRLAQKTAEVAPPGSQPFVFAAFYASQVAAVLAAATKAKAIFATAPGGGSSPTISAPSVNPLNASIFNLPPQAQDVRVTNQSSQVVRAFITNEDLRTAQERQAFLNKLSSF